jgi:hypothetical protein
LAVRILGFAVAHQGGWDEMLFVAVPIALFAGLLVLANKRAARDLADRDVDAPSGRPE